MIIFPLVAVLASIATADPAVLFINFDGAALERGVDDSRANTTIIEGMDGPFPAYGGSSSQRNAIVQAVESDWAAYNVEITDRRPTSGNYVMNLVGPSENVQGAALGIAVQDCDDALTANNITFAFHGADDGFSASAVATTISHEIAHSFGLEHVSDPDSIMNPFNSGVDPSFQDACAALSETPICPDQHIKGCGGDGTQQNAHAELFRYVGPAAPVTEQLTIEIMEPMDGDRFTVDEAFVVSAE